MGLENYKLIFLQKSSQAAERAGHPFPQYAACEAALESGFGTSGLYHNGLNPFGMKAHAHPVYGTLSIPTNEFFHNEWVTVDANWVKYPDLDSAFRDRLATLERLRHTYANYDIALNAKTGADFVNAVSKTWSTDPRRADKVLAIFREWTGAAA
jgi:flagellum-specific peptidoglycan hydrolase FlgJ